MPPVVIFDPQTSGHHREFLWHLLRGLEGILSPVTFWVHPDFTTSGTPPLSREGTWVRALPGDLTGSGKDLPSAEQAQAQLGFLLHEVPEGSHIFFPRINTYTNALHALPDFGKRFTCSGILFSPATTAWCHRGGGLQERLRSIYEIHRLRRLRRDAGLQRLYVLNDACTAAVLARWVQLPGGILPLADPMLSSPEDPGIAPLSPKSTEQGRGAITFLLLGAQRPNKGSIETLRAFQTWRPPPDISTRLLLAGEVSSDLALALRKAIATFQSASPATELVADFNFLNDTRFENYLATADFILLPYRRALGSSGLLGHAARFSKPVLSTEEGLMGSLVRNHALGHTFSVNSVSSWHAALDAAVKGRVQMNSEGRIRYLKHNSIEAFQEALRNGFQELPSLSK